METSIPTTTRRVKPDWKPKSNAGMADVGLAPFKPISLDEFQVVLKSSLE